MGDQCLKICNCCGPHVMQPQRDCIHLWPVSMVPLARIHPCVWLYENNILEKLVRENTEYSALDALAVIHKKKLPIILVNVSPIDKRNNGCPILLTALNQRNIMFLLAC
jgi:hypothetical protein